MTESVSHADPFTPLRPINHDRLEGPQLLFPSAGVIE